VVAGVLVPVVHPALEGVPEAVQIELAEWPDVLAEVGLGLGEVILELAEAA
jgi:hypothetical protein